MILFGKYITVMYFFANKEIILNFNSDYMVFLFYFLFFCK